MTDRDDDNMLAAEYVAGLLHADEHAAAERRMATDAEFARQVEQWRTRLSAFDESAPMMEADATLWQRIESSLATQHTTDAEQQPGFFQYLWSSIAGLRVAAMGAAAAAVVFAVLGAASLQYARVEMARKPVYVAILVNDDNKQPGAVVNAFANGRVEMIPLTQIDVPPGRALEIWTLWDRNVGPRSVGLIDAARTTTLNLDKLPTTGPDQLFEITLEPVGGSPIGRPTGPILYKGTTARAL